MDHHHIHFERQKGPAHARQAYFIQCVIRLGVWRSVGVITLASVLGSLVITALYYVLFMPSLLLLKPASWAISVVAPLIIAPLASFYFVHLLIELDKVRQLTLTLAVTDGLTGLCNRSYFMAQLDTELSKALRHKVELSLIMVDADHFKVINDKYGHDVGDAVLKAVADAAKNCLRDHDVLARYGGEEFVVLLPHTDVKGAASIAERVRSSVEQLEITSADAQTVRATVSLGVASLNPSHATRADLLKSADQALYQAKDLGRNRVQVASTGLTYCAGTDHPPQTAHS